MKSKFAQVYGIEKDDVILYVGVTTQDLRQRISSHYSSSKNDYRGARKLNAWLKTKPKFNVRLLELCPVDEKFVRESFWINHFKTIETGLNCPPQGGTGREKGCENPTGKDHYLYGKKVDPKIWKASVAKRQKKIQCIETNEIFENQKVAADRLKCMPTRFSEFFNGKIDNVKGFTFKRI